MPGASSSTTTGPRLSSRRKPTSAPTPSIRNAVKANGAAATCISTSSITTSPATFFRSGNEPYRYEDAEDFLVAGAGDRVRRRRADGTCREHRRRAGGPRGRGSVRDGTQPGDGLRTHRAGGRERQLPFPVPAGRHLYRAGEQGWAA